MKIHKAYQPYTDKDSDRYGIEFKQGSSKTKQAFRDECDINKIVKRMEKTGRLPDLIKENPQFGDFSDVGTYQEAMNVFLLATQQFDALDSYTRKRFDNDPAQFLAFAEDPANQEEMVKMGLATARPLPAIDGTELSGQESRQPRSPEGSKRASSSGTQTQSQQPSQGSD